MLISRNRFDRLIANDLFSLLPAHVRKEVYDKSENRIYKQGETIFRKDDDGEWMAAVLAGRIRIARHNGEGREMLVTMVEQGEMFGERAVYDHMPRSASAFAEEEAALQIFHRDDLMPVFYAYPDTLMYIIRTLCYRMNRYLNMMELYALHSISARLANLLLYLGQKYGKSTPKGIHIQANLSQSDIAHQMASSRESINRQLNVFAREKLIALEGTDIFLVDTKGLEDICHPPSE